MPTNRRKKVPLTINELKSDEDIIISQENALAQYNGIQYQYRTDDDHDERDDNLCGKINSTKLLKVDDMNKVSTTNHPQQAKCI